QNFVTLSLLLSTASPHSVLYTLSLHDALPISWGRSARSPAYSSITSAALSLVDAKSTALRAVANCGLYKHASFTPPSKDVIVTPDRKSTRLNSSHVSISYAVFCLKKKNYANST